MHFSKRSLSIHFIFTSTPHVVSLQVASYCSNFYHLLPSKLFWLQNYYPSSSPIDKWAHKNSLTRVNYMVTFLMQFIISFSVGIYSIIFISCMHVTREIKHPQKSSQNTIGCSRFNTLPDVRKYFFSFGFINYRSYNKSCILNIARTLAYRGIEYKSLCLLPPLPWSS